MVYGLERPVRFNLIDENHGGNLNEE